METRIHISPPLTGMVISCGQSRQEKAVGTGPQKWLLTGMEMHTSQVFSAERWTWIPALAAAFSHPVILPASSWQNSILPGIVYGQLAWVAPHAIFTPRSVWYRNPE